MARIKEREVGRRIQQKSKANELFSADELLKLPELPDREYNSKVGKIMRHLGNFKIEDMKKEFDEYIRRTGTNISLKRKPYEVASIGKVCWILNKGGNLKTHHIQVFNEKLIELAKKEIEPEAPKEIVAPKPQGFKHDYILLTELDKLLDTHKYSTPIETLIQRDTKKEVVDDIIVVFNSYKDELDQLETDRVLQEAYSHLTPARLKKRKKFIEKVLTFLNGFEVEVAKPAPKVVVRKPRVKKPTDKAKQVKNFKHIKQTELFGGIEGCSPIRVIGATEVVCYDIEKRVIYFYKGEKLSISGSSIEGYDETLSYSKKIRKPDEFMSIAKKLTTMTKMVQLIDAIKTKKGSVSGRGSLSLIILKITQGK
jgi:hypothetical protein